MNSLSTAELQRGVQYKLYGNGGCKDMESTIYRMFMGMDCNGNALFYDDCMRCVVAFDKSWKIYRI